MVRELLDVSEGSELLLALELTLGSAKVVQVGWERTEVVVVVVVMEVTVSLSWTVRVLEVVAATVVVVVVELVVIEVDVWCR
jgi:hypothetical protein